MTKFIFMTGGVVSGIGKGLSAASIGRLLKDRGFSVFMQKFDPYLNVFPGLLNPIQHGEPYVTYDGGETDLDLGHYERFIDEKLSTDSSISAGKVYKSVFQKEERGDYKGNTIQVIPHVTDQIKSKVYKVASDSKADIVITEIGGTVGDIESLPFIEAIRQIYSENENGDVIFIHTTLVPTIPGSNELKTKPTQHSYKQLMSYGIRPSIFVLRSDEIISDDIKKKISLFCDIKPECIIQSENVNLIYEVPVSLRRQGIDEQIMKLLHLQSEIDTFGSWVDMVDRFKNLQHEINIAMVGQYVELEDSYLSTNNALLDAGYNLSTKVNIKFMSCKDIENRPLDEVFKNIDGIIIPSGISEIALNSILATAKYARENKIPTLGIASGQHIMAIEFARNVLGIEKASSEEFDEMNKNNIIKYNDYNVRKIGDASIAIDEGTLANEIYQMSNIVERHKNEFEISPKFEQLFEEHGFTISGKSEDGKSIEIIELKDNEFYFGVLYQPQYDSRPNRPHPIFTKFVNIALGN